jgi:hypothetical protein
MKIRQLIKDLAEDEQGFLHIYLSGMYAIYFLLFFGFLLASGLCIWHNAVASYSCLTEAGDFAMHAALQQGIATATNADTSDVESIFIPDFQAITQTALNTGGSAFEPVPGSGSPFPGPITIDNSDWFTPESAGSILPNGATAAADGFWITVTAPVQFGTVAWSPGTFSIPMHYFAEL